MAKKKHYIKGRWAKKYDNFECMYCSFATLDKEEMEQHIESKHTKLIEKLESAKKAPKKITEKEEVKGLDNG